LKMNAKLCSGKIYWWMGINNLLKYIFAEEHFDMRLKMGLNLFK
jgi:hypothetical protein